DLGIGVRGVEPAGGQRHVDAPCHRPGGLGGGGGGEQEQQRQGEDRAPRVNHGRKYSPPVVAARAPLSDRRTHRRVYSLAYMSLTGLDSTCSTGPCTRRIGGCRS